MVYSVSDAVREILSELTFLRSSMDYDLLNYAAVARFIHPVVSNKLNNQVSLEAVAVAVRRHIELNQSQPSKPLLLNAVKNAKLTLRTDLCLLVVKLWVDVDFLEKMRAVIREVDFRAGEKLYMIARSSELFIVCNSRFMPTIESKVAPPAKLTAKTQDLALITVNVQATDFEVPGVLQFFSQQFEIAGINLLDVFSTRGKITFIFSQRDAAKAYERISSAIEAVKAMPLSSHLKQGF